MNNSSRVGVISAIDAEHRQLTAGLTVAETRTVAGRQFHAGWLDGQAVVVVRAGIGKVNATLAASLLCGMFECRGLLVGGVAGSLGSALVTGDVMIGRRIVCHDYGARVAERLVVYQPGRPPLPTVDRQYGYDLPEPLLSALRTGLADLRPRVTFGTIVSGDALIACDATRAALHRDFGAEAVEMEGAAVAQLAARFCVPAVIVRAISDQAGATHATEVREHLATAAEAAARTARAVLPILAMALDRGWVSNAQQRG